MWISAKQVKSTPAAISENGFLTGFAIQIGRSECYIGIPSRKGGREDGMNDMETMEEELITDEIDPADEQADSKIYMKAWPVMPDGPVKEFEEYLMDLGLRF